MYPVNGRQAGRLRPIWLSGCEYLLMQAAPVF